MKVVYFLYRKGGRGIVTEVGGTRLGGCSVLIPSSMGDEIVDKLSALGANARKLEIYMSEDQFKGQLVNGKPMHARAV